MGELDAESIRGSTFTAVREMKLMIQTADIRRSVTEDGMGESPSNFADARYDA